MNEKSYYEVMDEMYDTTSENPALDDQAYSVTPEDEMGDVTYENPLDEQIEEGMELADYPYENPMGMEEPMYGEPNSPMLNLTESFLEKMKARLEATDMFHREAIKLNKTTGEKNLEVNTSENPMEMEMDDGIEY